MHSQIKELIASKSGKAHKEMQNITNVKNEGKDRGKKFMLRRTVTLGKNGKKRRRRRDPQRAQPTRHPAALATTPTGTTSSGNYAPAPSHGHPNVLVSTPPPATTWLPPTMPRRARHLRRKRPRRRHSASPAKDRQHRDRPATWRYAYASSDSSTGEGRLGLDRHDRQPRICPPIQARVPGRYPWDWHCAMDMAYFAEIGEHIHPRDMPLTTIRAMHEVPFPRDTSLRPLFQVLAREGWGTTLWLRRRNQTSGEVMVEQLDPDRYATDYGLRYHSIVYLHHQGLFGGPKTH